MGSCFGVHLGRIDLIALQNVLHQSSAAFDHELAIVHTIVSLDDGFLFRFEA
ncbi:hypothetical protein D3C81_2126860 [compost metagenome]